MELIPKRKCGSGSKLQAPPDRVDLQEMLSKAIDGWLSNRAQQNREAPPSLSCHDQFCATDRSLRAYLATVGILRPSLFAIDGFAYFIDGCFITCHLPPYSARNIRRPIFGINALVVTPLNVTSGDVAGVRSAGFTPSVVKSQLLMYFPEAFGCTVKMSSPPGTLWKQAWSTGRHFINHSPPGVYSGSFMSISNLVPSTSTIRVCVLS